MEHNQNNTFQYTYSAGEQAEVKRIRSKYAPKEEAPLERLKRMDAAVTNKATARAITFGVIGALIFGFGMSCCLAFDKAWFIPGIIVGLVGIIAVSLTYPLYNRTLQKERQRIAPEVLRLTDELMK